MFRFLSQSVFLTKVFNSFRRKIILQSREDLGVRRQGVRRQGVQHQGVRHQGQGEQSR